jgi:hypothetical protein
VGSTLAELVTLVRSQADIVNSPHITDTEVEAFLNRSWARLHDFLIRTYEDYQLTSVNFTTTAGTDFYDLSDGSTIIGAATAIPYKLRGLDLKVGTLYVPMPTFNFKNRGQYVGVPNVWVAYGQPVRYRFDNMGVRLAPNPDSAKTLRVWYVPKMPALVTTVTAGQEARQVAKIPDYVQKAWEELVILDAAIMCAAKEEGIAGNIPILVQERNEKIVEIRSGANNRDANEGWTIAKVADLERGWTDGFNSGPYGPGSGSGF